MESAFLARVSALKETYYNVTNGMIIVCANEIIYESVTMTEEEKKTALKRVGA